MPAAIAERAGHETLIVDANAEKLSVAQVLERLGGRPEILVADEPTGNVDQAMADRLLLLFDSLNRLGTTVVVATHNDTLVARHPGPSLRLEAGRLVGDG